MTASPSPPSPGPMHVLIGEGLQVLTCPSTTQASLVRPHLKTCARVLSQAGTDVAELLSGQPGPYVHPPGSYQLQLRRRPAGWRYAHAEQSA